jgi:hypothetical protein
MVGSCLVIGHYGEGLFIARSENFWFLRDYIILLGNQYILSLIFWDQNVLFFLNLINS